MQMRTPEGMSTQRATPSVHGAAVSRRSAAISAKRAEVARLRLAAAEAELAALEDAEEISSQDLNGVDPDVPAPAPST